MLRLSEHQLGREERLCVQCDVDRRANDQAQSSESQQTLTEVIMKIIKGHHKDRFVTPSWKVREKLQKEEKSHEVKTKQT